MSYLREETVPQAPRPLPDGPLYFVGIGGAGQSAIAFVLAQQGRQVSGADPGISPATRARLEAVGVTVYTVHDAANLYDAACVIATDAVNETNPEIVAAREKGLPLFRRPEALGAIVNAGRGIAIAGTHGKTTTTGMVASVLLAANLDPTIIIGGDLPAIGGNARAGKSDIVLAESCEAYNGFLYLHPEIAVVTNVEPDHLDFHKTEENVVASFQRFVSQVRPDGWVFFCTDDGGANDLFGGVAFGTAPGYEDAMERMLRSFNGQEEQSLPTMRVGYGTDDELNVVYAADIDLSGPRPSFTLFVEGEDWGRIHLSVPGLHNIQNALAAACVGHALELAPKDVVRGLESFTGTGRRFERLGEAGGVLIIDDYAHHPTEIRATLNAARNAFPGQRIVAVFQPHLPSRTRDFLDDFASALALADVVYLTDIYLAREQPLPGVSSEVLAEKTRGAGAKQVVYVGDKKDLPAQLARDVRAGDIVLTMGAGDIRRAGEDLLALLG